MSDDIIRYDDMYLEEGVVVTVPFGDELPTGVTLSGTPAVVVSVVGGASDPTPSALIVDKQISGSNVLVALDGSVAGVQYEFRVTCSTTNANLRPTRCCRIYVK